MYFLIIVSLYPKKCSNIVMSAQMSKTPEAIIYKRKNILKNNLIFVISAHEYHSTANLIEILLTTSSDLWRPPLNCGVTSENFR